MSPDMAVDIRGTSTPPQYRENGGQETKTDWRNSAISGTDKAYQIDVTQEAAPAWILTLRNGRLFTGTG